MSEIRIDQQDGDDVWPPDTFTGLWEIYWPNMQIKYRAEYIDGNQHGRVECWWDNGTLAQTGICDHGKCIGIWTDNRENGLKFKETEYADEDKFVVRWYDLDGSIYREDRYINGRCISK